MIICDVCENIIVAESGDDGRLYCSNCGFDNTYQIEEDRFANQIGNYMEIYEHLSEIDLIIALVEKFGITDDQANTILREQDLLGENLTIHGLQKIDRIS